MLLPPPPPSDCCFSFSSLSLGCRSQTDSLILVREESRWVGVAAALAGRPPRSILFAATAAALSAGSTRWMAAFSATAISFFSRAPRGFSPDVYLTFGCLVFFFFFLFLFGCPTYAFVLWRLLASSSLSPSVCHWHFSYFFPLVAVGSRYGR